ncbi:UNVERIFIED_CONTAM: hypothetical protein HDU68_006813, partial [Siphonaria sp. JEL0065]
LVSALIPRFGEVRIETEVLGFSEATSSPLDHLVQNHIDATLYNCLNELVLKGVFQEALNLAKNRNIKPAIKDKIQDLYDVANKDSKATDIFSKLHELGIQELFTAV